MSRLCALFGVSRPGYYARIRRGASRRAEQDRVLMPQILGIFDKNKGRYGSPRVHQALRRAGVRVSRRRVERLMRAGGMRGRVARIYRSRPGLHKVYGRHQNLLWKHRAKKPDQIWVGDVTYVRSPKRWSYIATVMDRCSLRIVGWRIARKRGTDLTGHAFNAAFRSRRPERLIFHSDRGSEYCAADFGERLDALGVRQSTTRGGAPEDNPHAESFFHTLKAELIHGASFASEGDLRTRVREYVRYYNCERLHSSLGYRPPAEFEAQISTK